MDLDSGDLLYRVRRLHRVLLRGDFTVAVPEYCKGLKCLLFAEVIT